MVSHKGGLSEGWSFIKVVCQGWFLIKVVYHSIIGVVCHKGGLSGGWSLIKVVYHRVGFS